MNFIQRVKTLKDVFATSWQEIEKRTETPEIGVFLPTLNKKLYGLHRKELMVVASRPSNGKSSFLLQLAYNTAKQGLQTYFFSLEMTAEALSERLFCQVGQINNYNLFYKPTFYKKEAEDFKEMVKETPLIITYNIGTTIEQLFNILNDLPKADLVIKDYLQAIKSL